MNMKKTYIILSLFLSLVLAKADFDGNALRRVNKTVKYEPQEVYNTEINESSQSRQNRTRTNYFLDTFDSDLDGWTIDDGWNRTDINFHSPDYSMKSFDNNQSLPQLGQLTSPIYTLPEQPLNESIHYSFWLRNDTVSYTHLRAH